MSEVRIPFIDPTNEGPTLVGDAGDVVAARTPAIPYAHFRVTGIECRVIGAASIHVEAPPAALGADGFIDAEVRMLARPYPPPTGIVALLERALRWVYGPRPLLRSVVQVTLVGDVELEGGAA